jgi:hypothetical protein
LGTHLNDRLIARCAVSADVVEFIEANDLFHDPVQLVLAATEAPPGLRCHLYALVSVVVAREKETPEPWAASVPGAGYRASSESENESSVKSGQGMLFLGQIVRLDRDRKHPDNLGLEAADVLRRLVEGVTSEVVDRVLEDLLNEGPSS